MEKNGECSYTIATHTLILVCIRSGQRELRVASDGAAIEAPVSELWWIKGCHSRLPEDIPEWMQGNVQAGRGRFSDGISYIPRNCWPGATSTGAASASKNVEDKGKGKAEEGGGERGKKKAWEARDKDLNE
ncbi:hypothetical protein PIB30_069670 [Stylosanthes scabra]|uniref:Uncharacterized protein n=1 Tax=Stylosanthes scabra TaxID=79078 RepID=A0ABU6RNF9_9FABA|nr:hypothetical protein [Stylosanthes scabra]